MAVERTARPARCLAILLLTMAATPIVLATARDAADESIRQFLEQDDTQPAYRAERRLEAETGGRRGWMQAVTSYSPGVGFRYEITGEGGSSFIRSKVLRAVLDGEREVIEHGETRRSSLAPENYTFTSDGVDADGLASVLLTPRRKERVLIAGRMFLRPMDGGLVRLQGRLAKSPSFWLKHVDIVRHYDRIGGAIVPVALESQAQLRPLGAATLRMTYTYLEINGHAVDNH